MLASTYIATCPPDRGDFIVMKLDDLLLSRNALNISLSSEESVFALVEEDDIRYTDIGLQAHIQPFLIWQRE